MKSKTPKLTKVNKVRQLKRRKSESVARLYYTLIISAVLIQHYSVFTLNYLEETVLCNIKYIFSHCVLDPEHEAEALFSAHDEH